jgi:outer membrane translocation and assembly module TamA
LARRLGISFSVQQDLYLVPQADNPTLGDGELPTSYAISFVGQRFVLDLRDSPARTTRGGYVALMLSEAPRWQASDWTLVFIRPQARGYLRLPLDIVLAARLSLAWTLIFDASGELEPTSQRLGPSVYRLRGGGASSVRGFAPGALGAGVDGGIRRWEAMFEARLPLGRSFELAGLLDFGDVSQGGFRFSHLNTSAGFGLRFHSPIGALRLDTAFRVMSLQRTDGSRPAVTEREKMFLIGAPGAVHFTLGEAF